MANNKRFEELGYMKGREEEPKKQDQQAEGGLVRLTGLWLAKDGKSLIGSISPSSKLLIFENRYKEKSSSQPDYIAYIAPGSERPAPTSKDEHPF